MKPTETHAPSAGVLLGSIAGCAAFGLATFTSPLVLALAVLVVSSIVGLTWMHTLDVPCPSGGRWTLVLGASLTCLAALGDGTGQLPNWLPAAFAATLVLHLVQQLLRDDGRPRLTETISVFTLGLALISAGALLVPVAPLYLGKEMLAVTMAGAVAAVLPDFLGRSETLRPWLLPLGMVLAAAGAIAAGRQLGITAGHAALLGISAAVVAHPVRWLLAQAPRTARLGPGFVAGLAAALGTGTLPLLLARLVILAA